MYILFFVHIYRFSFDLNALLIETNRKLLIVEKPSLRIVHFVSHL